MLPKIYLAGRMTGLGDRGADWRDRATAMLSPLVAVNPLLLELDSRDPAHIVKVDCTAIRDAQAVLCYGGVPSWGTAMELWHAKERGVPVVTWYGEPDLPLSPWLRYTSTEMHVGMSEAVNSIRERFVAHL